MSWSPSLVTGTVPHWQCDSCTVMKDKSCQIIQDVRGALSRASVAFWPGKEFKSPYAASTESFGPVFETIEKHCRYSSLNKEKKNAA